MLHNQTTKPFNQLNQVDVQVVTASSLQEKRQEPGRTGSIIEKDKQQGEGERERSKQRERTRGNCKTELATREREQDTRAQPTQTRPDQTEITSANREPRLKDR